MTTDPDLALNLLVVDRSLNDADAYVSALRNAGIAVHPTRVGDDNELAEALTAKRPDLVLASCTEGNADLDQILSILSASDVLAPLVILTDNLTPALLTRARESGIRDIIEKGIAEQLQFVISREFHDLLVRRSMLDLKTRLAETESRCNALMQSSRDAIAYVHEGMHISANPVYLSMFGFVAMDDLEGLSVLDLVDPGDHGKLKKILRSLGNDADSAELDVSCVNSNGSTFAAKLEFSPASIDGERCEQIVIRDQSLGRDLEKKVQALATLDPLTGLASRNHLVDQIETDLAAARSGALLYLVIDSFQEPDRLQASQRATPFSRSLPRWSARR